MSRSQMNLIGQNILDSITAEQRRQDILAGKVYECRPWDGLYGECGKCQSCLDAAARRAASRRKIWNSGKPLCHYAVKDAFEIDWVIEWEVTEAFRDHLGHIVVKMEHFRDLNPRYIRFFSPNPEDKEIFNLFYLNDGAVFGKCGFGGKEGEGLVYLWRPEDVEKYKIPGVEIRNS